MPSSARPRRLPEALFATSATDSASAYSLTQALREAPASQGTEVYSIHPGPISTDMGAAAGLADIAEAPSLVGEALGAAMAKGECHPRLPRLHSQTDRRSVCGVCGRGDR